MASLDAVTLTGDPVELRPLDADDHDGLVAAARDGNLCTLGYTWVPRPEEMRAAVAEFRRQYDAGETMAFTVRRRDTGQVVGHTTFCHVDAENRRVEIGYTWFARSAQRTGVNTEQAAAARPCVRAPRLHRRRAAHALAQPAVAASDRAAGRQAGRRAAQPPDHAGRDSAGHGRLLDHPVRVAGRPERLRRRLAAQ